MKRGMLGELKQNEKRISWLSKKEVSKKNDSGSNSCKCKEILSRRFKILRCLEEDENGTPLSFFEFCLVVH